MALSKMSLKTAQKIFDIYADRLVELPNLKRTERYAYSDLSGYDLVDIFRATKLLTAYRVKMANLKNTESIIELERFAGEDDSALAGFDMYFVPNEIAEKLRTLDSTSEEDYAKALSLRVAFITKSPMSVLAESEETNSSFLKYCLSIVNESSTYWQLIYIRLNIQPE